VDLLVVQSYLTGSFPRSEQLIEATRAAARGKISPSVAEEAFRNDLAELVQLQIEAGLDFVVDGQLNWQDLFRPFSELFAGIQLGSLERWFDNNTFYRRPIVVDRVRFKGTTVDQYFRHGLLPANRAKKAILPGPYTFAAMCQNAAYQSTADLVDDIAHSLREIVTQLRRTGYQYFQFNEPYICYGGTTENELDMLKNALETCAKGIGEKTALQFYFGDASSFLDTILNCPIDCVGLDLYATSLDSLIEHDFTKELGCGCIDGRNSLLESWEDLKKLVGRIEEDVDPKGIFLCPNCDLEFLPHTIAKKKIRILSEAKEKTG
jgi:5-methyltetrahydropteroyltriglutamate--homocysteine methyltransferase